MAGTVHQYWGDDEGFMFFSHDDAPGRQGQKMRTLHLVVTGVAADSGPRVFHVIVGANRNNEELQYTTLGMQRVPRVSLFYTKLFTLFFSPIFYLFMITG
jgi:hypothetical protein